MNKHASIIATAAYLPERILTNAQLAAELPAAAAEAIPKFAKGSGILQRHIAPDAVVTSDLAVRAGREALERAGVSPSQLDLIIVGTDTPDFITPATSVVVQHKLGATNAGTFDVGCACASFPTAIASAAGIIQASPGIDRVLVIGAYLMHRLADPLDPVRFFYGDGAGAALVVRSESPGYLASAFRADGSYAENWCIKSGGTVEPASAESVAEGRTKVRLYGAYPPSVNEEGWTILARQVVRRAGLKLTDIDHFIFTQVRKETIERVMANLEMPIERAPMIMDRVGYTGSACIPIALHDAVKRGVIHVGDNVVMVGSGVGYNQAAVALRISESLHGSGVR